MASCNSASRCATLDIRLPVTLWRLGARLLLLIYLDLIRRGRSRAGAQEEYVQLPESSSTEGDVPLTMMSDSVVTFVGNGAPQASCPST